MNKILSSFKFYLEGLGPAYLTVLAWILLHLILGGVIFGVAEIINILVEWYV